MTQNNNTNYIEKKMTTNTKFDIELNQYIVP